MTLGYAVGVAVGAFVGNAIWHLLVWGIGKLRKR